MSEISEMGGTTAGAVAGFQAPLGIRKRKKNVDEMLQLHEDIDEGLALAYFLSLDEETGERVGKTLESLDYESVAREIKEHAVRKLVELKVKEIVRKKAGGGGYVLYSPNQGKKRPAKPVGSFPTKLGAKRAELSRYPPKEPGKLKRLRKEVDRLLKDPKKRAEREKSAGKQKGTAKLGKKKKNEAVGRTGTDSFDVQTDGPGLQDGEMANQKEGLREAPIHHDVMGFMTGLKALPKTGPERGKYITAHMNDPQFLAALQKHPQGKQVHQQLTSFLNSPANAGAGKGVVKAESMHRKIVATIIKEAILRKIVSVTRSGNLNESLFQEERTGSEWDEYISRMSSKVTTGDKKFQKLQQNISKQTAAVLQDSLKSISKAAKKTAKLKDYGIKRSDEKGKTYLAFGATLGDSEVAPIYIYIEGGVPKIEFSDQARSGLTKADQDLAKLFRAELITVQERVLDKMESLHKSIETRDKYLSKVEDEVDNYVAGLTPLQLSLLKKLLVAKYRKH